MKTLNDLVLTIQHYLSDYVLIIALLGGGIWFTFKLGFIQVRGFGEGMRRTFGGLFSKKGNADKDGMSSFQALATAIAAQVGTGNIAGAATALAIGGPGAIFWMWIAAFLGMATIFGEAVLAQKYKQVGSDGEITGGPVYYIRAAFKGTFGKVLIAAGSAGMCGAAYLSALTAYRAGAGLVKILTVEENRPILQGLLPEAIIASYTPDQLLQGREEFKEMIEEQMKWASVVVLGPGLGSEPYVEYLVEDILTSAYVPVILDADGLNTIASHPYLTSYYTENIIITPHLGEMARLTGQTISQLKEDLVGAASAYASRYGVTCVLKDAATVVAGQEGGLYINTSGCSAMAKAGSGDVLTGTIAGLLAIGMEEEEAARMGVYVHGLAGEKAAGAGSHSLLATELSQAVGDVMDEAVRRNG